MGMRRREISTEMVQVVSADYADFRRLKTIQGILFEILNLRESA